MSLGDYGIPALVGGLGGVIGALVKDLVAARMKTDEELRDLRTQVYKTLWKLTEVLPKWPRADVKYSDLLEFSGKLRRWYFGEGGMYLSRRCQRRYAALQDTLSMVLSSATGREAEPVSDPDYDAVRDRCSALRTEMTEDLLSRRTGSRVLA